MQTVITNSVEETFKLGREFGSKLKGGEVIEFIGDLGAGKTSFMRGVAEGIGSEDSVSSPTFTLSNVYTSYRHPALDAGSTEQSEDYIQVHHFDFYRLNEPGLVQEQLKEALEDPKAIVCVEWAESVRGVLPEARTTIQITAIDEEKREFKFN
jgi:tRNA threonylcarbamoyladenosine biosynthesis protein TsaE